jgi:dTDP-glucose 4,6-dehydratase
MPKRVLITGGCGFIGGHTVEHLLRTTNWDITVLDGLRHAGNIRRLTDTQAFDAKRVRVEYHDLRAPLYADLIQRLGWHDYIINMASDSHVDRSISDPVPFIHNNVMLVLNMLEYAVRARPAKFIQIGTDEVFGPAPAGVSHKEDDPLKPSNPYSASKAAQEMIAFSYWRTYGVPLILTRTMNNFGERQDPEKFVPKVIRQVMRGETVTIHAQPKRFNADPGRPQDWTPGSRVWLHARNHADALRFILENVEAEPFSEGVSTPVRFNIAGEREISNLALADRIASLLNKPLFFTMADFHSSRPGHDLRYSLDGSALRAAGWDQPMTLDQSFEKMVKWVVANELG